MQLRGQLVPHCFVLILDQGLQAGGVAAGPDPTDCLHQRPAQLSGGALAGHSFVAFPCGHAFRLKCLEHALAPHERQRLSRPGPGALEEALAAECPLCGEAMVESVCKPFVDLEAEAALAASWAI